MIDRKNRFRETPLNGGLSEHHFKHVLEAMGFDPDNDEGIRDTPARMMRAYRELLSGYSQDPKSVLGTTFPGEGYDEVVVLKDIPFASLCEHHVLPFTGHVSIAYLPGDRVVGLSKLARLVNMHSRRLQIQECMTRDIASDLTDVLNPKGVAVIVKAVHTCMTIRGVGKPGASMITSSMQGVFREEPSARAELMTLLKD